MRRLVLVALLSAACGGGTDPVPQSLTIRAKGLYLTGSDLSAPDGALAQADDVVISREGVVETRRGMEVRGAKALARMFPFKGEIVGHNGTSTLSRSTDEGATWTDYGAAVTPPAGYPARAVEASSSLFVTDQVRPKRIDALTGTPEEAGVPGALDVQLTLSSAGSPTAMPNDSQLAYRILFGKKDANGRLLLGAPSSRGVIANSAGGVRDVTGVYSLPPGMALASSYFVQAYRTTASVNATTDAGDEMGLVYESPFPAQRQVTGLSRTSNVVTATTSVAHGFAAGQTVQVAIGVTGFPAATVAVASVPTSTTFTYSQSGADATSGALSLTYATPLTGVFTDTVPDGFIGAALYTNANQEGILESNDRPPCAREMAHYAGSLFLANITTPASAVVNLLAVGGASGVAVDDTITIGGITYTGKAVEDIDSLQFAVVTSGTIAQNIRDTADSIIRLANRDGLLGGSGIAAINLSGPDDPPGQIEFRATSPSASVTVSFSRTTAWSPTSISESPKTYKNGIVWSKLDQPDHFPKAQTLLPVKVGSDDKEILRVIPTRSALFILKEDGVWRVTGGNASFDIQPFDPTIRVIGPETAVQLDNAIYALSEQGVVRISDTGVSVVSRPIESALLALTAPALRSTTATYAFGVGYESDRKYLLWLPSASTDTKATQAYVYDLFTNAWTRRTDDYAHAIVNPADDRLYGVDGTSAWQERKALDHTDLADQSHTTMIVAVDSTHVSLSVNASLAAAGDVIERDGVYAIVVSRDGAAVTLDRAAAFDSGLGKIYKAIPTAVKWAPKFGSSPLALSELQEIVLFWDEVYFSTATVSFSTNISPAASSLTLNGSDYGWTGAANQQVEIRAWPPAEKAWGSQFNITLSHAQAWSPNAVSGLGLSFASRSTVVSR